MFEIYYDKKTLQKVDTFLNNVATRKIKMYINISACIIQP